MNEKAAASLTPGYFDDVYAAKDDPWEFATSHYEQSKYADTLKHLPRPRYGKAFEIGCSIGVLTALLAPHCDHLLSVDVSERALEQARKRCEAMPQVTFQCMQVPAQQPSGNFDLIVVSEVGYYWSSDDLELAIGMLAAHQRPGSHLVLVHWTPPVHDYPLTGDKVHNLWLARPEWRTLSDLSRERYRLSVLERL